MIQYPHNHLSCNAFCLSFYIQADGLKFSLPLVFPKIQRKKAKNDLKKYSCAMLGQILLLVSDSLSTYAETLPKHVHVIDITGID